MRVRERTKIQESFSFNPAFHTLPLLVLSGPCVTLVCSLKMLLTTALDLQVQPFFGFWFLGVHQSLSALS